VGANQQTEEAVIAQCEPEPYRNRIEAASPRLTDPIVCAVPAYPATSTPGGGIGGGGTIAALDAETRKIVRLR
jgi:hypothetical protein